MKFILKFLILVTAYSCSNENTNSVAFVPLNNKVNDTTSRQDESLKDSCQVKYDTITELKYYAHKFILQKSQDNWNGDPIWSQDVCAFLQNLDPNENETNRKLTNKVVFKVLENASNHLAFCFLHQSTPAVGLDYFLDNVSNPTCDEISMDTLISKVDHDFVLNLYSEERNRRVREIKSDLLKRLKKNK